MVTTKLAGRRRAGAPDLTLAEEPSVDVTARHELLVVNGMPGVSEVVRYGHSYFAFEAVAVAPVVAVPTTTAQVALWNGESAGGYHYVIDSLFGVVVVSAAAATSLGFAIQNQVTRVSAAPAGSTITPVSLDGNAYSGRGKVVLAATVANEAWHVAEDAVVGPASQVAMTFGVRLNGLYPVPPGGIFSFSALANTAAAITVRIGVRWHEVLYEGRG